MQKKQQQKLQQLQLGFMFSELQASADPESFQNFFCLGIVLFGQFVFHVLCNVLDKNLSSSSQASGQGKETWQQQMGLWIPLPSSLFWQPLPSTFKSDLQHYTRCCDMLRQYRPLYIRATTLYLYPIKQFIESYLENCFKSSWSVLNWY